MVGVPGKYKGCNTCRTRRVKVRDMENIDYHQAAHERETVFIVGTVEDKGRCSSHPPRTSKGSKKSPSPPRTSEDREDREKEPGLVLASPLQPAWYDQIFVSHSGSTHRLEIVALYTPLGAVARNTRMKESETNFLSIPPYRPIDIGGAGFELHSQCLSHTSPERDDSDSTLPGSTVLFLFEHNPSLASSNLQWSSPVAQHTHMKQLGPRRFRTFPSHHFFARVYRPNAITAAILNRQGIFCADPEWTTVPFELHHKCTFDRLLDLLARAPALLQRLDQLLIMDPTLARRLAAQDLLGNCLNLQSLLEQWLAAAHNYAPKNIYWISAQEHGEIPFTEKFSFQSSLDSLSMLYYWSVQILMRPCIEMLIHTIFSPVLDTYPQVYPDLPPQLNINPVNYGPRIVREYAANVCRGLDYALQTTTQPDMLAFPVQVVETYYGGLNIQVGDGALELMWLVDFRGRMAMRGRALACAVTGKGWTDLAAW
ncbi:hypothetical protein VPNG_03991 [Cytospora leucostoma]|uniref:Uncharacterized protein n=1 Tax=Cytospora leucostoma TaxID=1230097 RepID=A0A423XEF4_9PEZI|nr:hypothetical protein VPNG_03991 [Cytospora leucostoma]